MTILDLGSHQIHYQVLNPHNLTTRPLVLLHGLGSSGEDWALQQSYFCERFPVITLDLRGHGRSSVGEDWPTIEDYVTDVHAVLEEITNERAHLMGLSLGGAVALQFALDWPKRTLSLTIVNAFAKLEVGPRGWIRALGRLFLLAIGRMDWVGAWIAAGIFPNPEQDAWRKAAAARIGGNPRSAYVRSLWAVARFNAIPRLQEIEVPTLIVAGEQDTTVSLEAKRKMAEGIQHSRLEIIPDSGHATPYDASDRLNQLVRDFLLVVD